jgi:hypothetical protein
MSKIVMLSTIDNPHSPIDDFKAWYAYDVASGYFTTDYLGRVANLSHDLSDLDYDLAIEQVVDEIIKENVLGIYIKVEKEVPD